jgi:lipopolysaccharide/colanic/teichoic acid biosynthesis glycosyltransferase
MAASWIESGRGKRTLDLVLAVPAIVVMVPVAAATGLLVRSRLGHPLLFHQIRAGRYGDPVRVSKFRSMSNASDASGNLLPDEERLTRFGRALRASSLDELPQLLSVVMGDMSLVGPRPLPLAYVQRYDSKQRRRLDAKPGITGWAQVNGRNATSWPDRLAQDVWYVDNASFRLDIKILWLTVKAAAGRTGVSADGHATMREFLGEVEEGCGY